MEICGQLFGEEVIRRIRDELSSTPELSQRALSRRVCQWLGWRSGRGELQDANCRKALKELARRGVIELPVSEERYAFARRRRPLSGRVGDLAEVECDLKDLGHIEVVPVSSRYSKSSGTWNALMDRYHYLGGGPFYGAQIRYVIRSEHHGCLGGLSFSGASWALRDRDRFIGWSEQARGANLQKVVCNSRFLIVPTVCVPNLASHVLSLSVSRLSDDWQRRYGYRPVLAETFVDPTLFHGTCYRAANWRKVGRTAGRRTSGGNLKKDIYVYELSKDWRSILQREPSCLWSRRSRPEKFSHWTQEEFWSVQWYDRRLTARLMSLASDFFDRPGELVPDACQGSKAKIKGAYRFFNNERVDMQAILLPHKRATIERMKEHQVVLAPQDTTTLNYTAHPCEEMGPIGKRADKAQGLIVHDTMAFSEQGTPLGLLDVQCWARDPKEHGKKHKRKQLPIEAKESMKWLKSYRAVGEAQQECPETMVVSVGDREADIYELFHEALRCDSGPELLVRAERSRNRKVGQHHLWEEMASREPAGVYEVAVPRRGSRRARRAKLNVHFGPVTLKAPQTKKEYGDIELWAVYAVETDYPQEVTSPLEWMLLTTIAVKSFAQARRCLKWYATRWGIEEYHRTLKTGCRIKDRMLRTVDRLESCLAIDMVVAWRVSWLTKQARETPEVSCDEVLTQDEWQVACARHSGKPPPQEPPSLITALVLIATLGGFIGSKAYPFPGTTTLWRGLVKLENMVEGYQLALSVQRQRDGP